MAVKFSTVSELGRGLLVTGAAGTGKTHALSSIIETLAPTLNMRPFQVVPVLSAMHGARRRLLQRLTAVQKLCRDQNIDFFVEVSTIDAFVLSLVARLQERSESDWPDFETGDFSPAHRAAIAALGHESIRKVCATTFPFVAIDEFQDCRGSQLAFVEALAKSVPVIIAADDFQVLDDAGSCPALDWGKGLLRTVDLGGNSIRTNDSRVIATAQALRSGSATSSGVSCYFAPSGDVAAAMIMNVVRRWTGSTVVLAFKCEGSHFVEQTFRALTKPRRHGERMRPLSFGWAPSAKTEREIALSPLSAMPETLLATTQARELGLSESLYECWNRCARRSRRRGRSLVHRDELFKELRRELHFRRAFATRSMRRVFTTIHSAKNQEWHNVVVLWSQTHFRASTPDALKRRLLYNAVTRAKVNCVIIADGPAYKWANDSVFALLQQPTENLIKGTRPKNPDARRPRKRAVKARRSG